MPAPTTVDEFVDLVRKSAVLDEPRLTAYVQKLKADPNTPNDLSGVAGLFVRDGLLTYFQAEQFLQGKWKRFSIGKYKVLERLGSGGMGQVFLCEHKLMRRRVAVKVLPVNKASDPSSLDRFYREARAVAALDHPNIVRAYDIDQDDNLHFLVMEYVDGASLQEMVKKTGPMDVTRACHYMYWSAVGLQNAHQNGLIHRDIKPGNILVDRQGVVKILDLGLARFFHDEDDLITKKYDESVLGTADYLAPEQAIDSHMVDGRADIYSLGATFYFLLTGQPPYADGSVAQKLLWHQTRTPKSVKDLRPDVPADVAAVLNKMMAKKPEDRYATPADLAEALLPFTQTPIPPPPEAEMPQLSAAAQGTAAGPVSVSAAPRTMVTSPKTPPPIHGPRPLPTPQPAAKPTPPTQPTRPEPAVALAEADTQRNKPVPAVEPIPESSPGVQVWESIGADTTPAGRADTDKRNRNGRGSSRKLAGKPPEGSKSGARKPEPAKPKSGKKQKPARKPLPLPLILMAAGGLVLLLGGAFAVYWFAIRDPKGGKGPDQGKEGAVPRTLVVAKNGGGNYQSVQKALDAAGPGDAIEIRDDEVEESAAATRKVNLVIRGEGGKRVTWKAPPSKRGNAPHLLSLAGADGVRISGITFQAGGQADHAVRLSGPCPGLVLEDVELAGGTTASLAVIDCVGAKDRPVTVRKARIAGGEAKAGVVFGAASKGSFGSQYVHLDDCLLDGPAAGPAVQFEGTATAIDVRHCRFWKAGSGIVFKKLVAGLTPASAVWQVNVVSNTFRSLAGPALVCEEPGQMIAQKKPEDRIVLAQNFFAELPMVADVRGNPPADQTTFLVVEPTNLRKAGLPAGYPPLEAIIGQVNGDVPADPANPGTFLRYEKKGPLTTTAPKPAGAPPPPE